MHGERNLDLVLNTDRSTVDVVEEAGIVVLDGIVDQIARGKWRLAVRAVVLDGRWGTAFALGKHYRQPANHAHQRPVQQFVGECGHIPDTF